MPEPESVAGCERFRIGLIVVDNDPVPEIEIRNLAPTGVSIHVVRFHLPRSMGSEYTGDPAAQPVTSHILEVLHALERIGVDAVGLCFTSSSIFNPSGFDAAFRAAALKVNPSWVVCTAAEALVSAMHEAGVRNPYVLVPPWFTEPTIAALHDYLANRGIGMADAQYFELSAAWDVIPRQDRFDHGAKWHIHPREVMQNLLERDLKGADSILIPGSGFPSLDVLTQEPPQLPLPLFTANGATLDALLKGSRPALSVSSTGGVSRQD